MTRLHAFASILPFAVAACAGSADRTADEGLDTDEAAVLGSILNRRSAVIYGIENELKANQPVYGSYRSSGDHYREGYPVIAGGGDTNRVRLCKEECNPAARTVEAGGCDSSIGLYCIIRDAVDPAAPKYTTISVSTCEPRWES